MFRFHLSLIRLSCVVTFQMVTISACCFSFSQHCNAQAGTWNASLKSPGGDLRFGLHIEQHQQGVEWAATIINGSERIKVPKVQRREDGTLVLQIDHYDSELQVQSVDTPAKLKPRLEGTWKKRRGKKRWVEMKFVAVKATDRAEKTQPDSKFDGRWNVKFESSDDVAVGVFESNKQSGQLHGTFLTTTGDYRFLAGTAKDDAMELSCFDGAHAFLFKAKLKKDGSISGDFWSSDTWHESWTATKDVNAKLPDSFTQTKAMKASINEIEFPNLDGIQTRLDDEKFAAPVRIVHIFGSWCPNCHDAGEYLAKLKAKYKDQISIVGIAFELTGDFERDAQQVRKYLTRHKLDHEVLIGGTSGKADASKAMTVIDRVRSYPTTIFANAKGEIIEVHQGFSGPATDEAYVKQSRKIESGIDEIIANDH